MQKDYSQPEFYRFNEDSTRLVHFIHKNIKSTPKNILDLGAGSGVIGFELSQIFSESELTLVEAQKEFLPYIDENRKNFYPNTKIIHSVFSKLNLEEKFDLIVSNPPYFLKGDGRESPSIQKQICRTWEIDSLEILIDLIQKSLSPTGEAWLSLRKEKKILDILKEINKVEIFPQSESLIYIRLVAA